MMPTGSIVMFYHAVQHSCLTNKKYFFQGNKKYLYGDRTVAVEDQHASFFPFFSSCYTKLLLHPTNKFLYIERSGLIINYDLLLFFLD